MEWLNISQASIIALFFIFTFGVQLTGCKGRCCPDEFVRHKYYRNTCYHINRSRNATDPREANKYCEKYNATLARIYNQVQIDFITDHADSIINSSVHADVSLLINLTSGTQDRFQWSNDEQGEHTYLSRNGPKWVLKNGTQSAPFVCEYTEDTDATTNVALTDGSSDSNGRLEIYYQGRWRPVCSSNEEKISYIGDICSMLGHCRSGRILRPSEFQHRSEDLLTNHLHCSGDKCSVRNETNECTHENQIGLSCYKRENPLLFCSRDGSTILKQEESRICPRKFHISDIKIPSKAIVAVLVVLLMIVNIVLTVLLIAEKKKSTTFKTCSTQTSEKSQVTLFNSYSKKDTPVLPHNGVSEFDSFQKPVNITRSTQTSSENLFYLSRTAEEDLESTDEGYTNKVGSEKECMSEKEFISCCIQTSIENLTLCCCNRDQAETNGETNTDITNYRNSIETKQFSTSSTQTSKTKLPKRSGAHSPERHVKWPTYEIVRIHRLTEEYPVSHLPRPTHKRNSSISVEKRQLLMPKEPWRYSYKVAYADPDTLDRTSYEPTTIDGKPCKVHQ